jgi:hypothetical protein
VYNLIIFLILNREGKLSKPLISTTNPAYRCGKSVVSPFREILQRRCGYIFSILKSTQYPQYDKWSPGNTHHI